MSFAVPAVGKFVRKFARGRPLSALANVLGQREAPAAGGSTGVEFTEHDRLFVQREYAEAVSGSTPYGFLSALHELCNSNCRAVVKGADAGGRYIAEQAIAALRLRRPFSMIRIGDGEGNVLGFALHDNAQELRWFNSIFYRQDGQTLGPDAARAFTRAFTDAYSQADVIGFTGLNNDPGELAVPEEAQRRIQSGIQDNPRVALGTLRALQFGRQALENRRFRHAGMTNAWVYIGLIPQLDRLMENAARVIVITGKKELKAAFEERLKHRLAAFMVIPDRACEAASEPRPSHYPARFNEIVEALRSDLRGALILVGAGILGKIYCGVARQHGGVALDLGSGFDLLAGKLTRPAHTNPKVVGPGIVPWITMSEAPQ
jgi:hypothetical protein